MMMTHGNIGGSELRLDHTNRLCQLGTGGLLPQQSHYLLLPSDLWRMSCLSLPLSQIGGTTTTLTIQVSTSTLLATKIQNGKDRLYLRFHSN